MTSSSPATPRSPCLERWKRRKSDRPGSRLLPPPSRWEECLSCWYCARITRWMWWRERWRRFSPQTWLEGFHPSSIRGCDDVSVSLKEIRSIHDPLSSLVEFAGGREPEQGSVSHVP